MSNINLDAGYFTHLKTKRLVKTLGAGAESLPIKLWCYTAAHYAETGILGGHSAEDIEAAVDWQGAPGAMVKAMTDVRFLDVLGDTSYQVHDWLEHSGHLAAFAQRARKAANARWGNASPMLKDAQASLSITSDDGSTAQPVASNAPTNQLTNKQTNQQPTRCRGRVVVKTLGRESQRTSSPKSHLRFARRNSSKRGMTGSSTAASASRRSQPSQPSKISPIFSNGEYRGL